MKLEKLLESRLFDRLIVSILSTADWLAKRVGPALVNRRPVQVERDRFIPSWDGQSVRIDLYTPKLARPLSGWPVALVIHGGGFRFFSKDTHALIAANIAEMGYLTICTDYRLAPKHPYPEGLIDTLSVYDWIQNHAANLGVDLNRLIIVGESAGANFGLGICLLTSGIATTQDLLMPSLESLQLTSVSKWLPPSKAILHCGYHQASGVSRYDGRVSAVVRARIKMIQKNYLPDSFGPKARSNWGLADPLTLLESAAPSALGATPKLPQLFIPVGDEDPVKEDSERLATAATRVGADSRLKIYPRAPHAFYAMPWNDQYIECWNDIEQFLKN